MRLPLLGMAIACACCGESPFGQVSATVLRSEDRPQPTSQDHSPTRQAATTPAPPWDLLSPGHCSQVVRPLRHGTFAGATDLTPARCPSIRPRSAFRYDPSAGAARATRDLTAGEVVPELPTFALPTVVPGQSIVLEVRIGAVRVARPVRALQAARPGQRLFVRAADDSVFAIECPEDRS